MGKISQKYFYPSVNTYTKIVDSQECPFSAVIAIRILCLPLTWNLKLNEIDRSIETIKAIVL